MSNSRNDQASLLEVTTSKDGANRRDLLFAGTALVASAAISSMVAGPAEAQAQTASPPPAGKPNILVIMGDDIGQSNISAYTFGVMGYRTPNIDRIAKEGMMFTDYYAEQSCTAGRSSFITGQSVLRTGLSKVGIPGATIGLRWAKTSPSPQALKPLGYATGQFGKNHLGDRNEFLPTVHGFDEFFGNLYHLNAEEDPEDPDYPKDPRFKERFGPRGVLRCKASDAEDPTVDPRFGKVGKQTIEDTGPLTKKRMETIDDETTAAAIDFIERQAKATKPFFVWMNTTRMHLYTHVRASMRGQSGMPDNEYADGMIEHDGDVGKLLKALDDLGIADNTIVALHDRQRPAHELVAGCGDDAVPQREGHQLGRRLPRALHGPLAGHIKPGGVSPTTSSAGHDWFPTLLAVAGDTGVKDRLLKGWQVGDRTYKVHLDGYNQLAYLTGQQDHSDRKGFIYFNDDAQLVAIRYADWKLVFYEQKTRGHSRCVGRAFHRAAIPAVLQSRMDPYERAEITSNDYYAWTHAQGYLMMAAQAIAAEFVGTFKEFPPRQKPQSFNLDQIVSKMQQPTDD